MLLVLQWQTEKRQEILFSLQSTKVWPANKNVTGPTESLDKLYFFQWFCIFPKSLSTVFDALSYLDICDSPNNSVGYQNYFRVEFNPMVKDCFSAGLVYVSLYCFAWGTVNVPEGFCLALETSSEAPSALSVGMKFRMCSLPCKVS